MPSTLGIVSSHYTRPPAPVSLLLQGNGTNGAQNNTFLDSSSTPKTIIRNGSVTQGSFSPFPLNGAIYNPSVHGGSAYFNGNGYLEVTDSNGFGFQNTGNYTIEAWIYITSDIEPYQMILGTGGSNNYWGLVGTTGGYYLVSYTPSMGVNDIQQTSGQKILLNTWTHVAWSRQSSILRYFVNGSLVNTSSSTDAIAVNSAQIGHSPYYNSFFVSGNICNLRIANVALYTSSFARPTAPLTTTSNGGGGGTAPNSSQVSLLLNFTNGGVIDSVAKNNLVTVGNAQISTAVKKYGSGSIYFDGSSDYLTSSNQNDYKFLHDGTTNYTVEGWFYTNSTAFQILFSTINDSSNIGAILSINGNGAKDIGWTVYRGVLGSFFDGNGYSNTNVWNLNTWNHFACTFNTSTKTIEVFLNGTKVYSYTNPSYAFSSSNPTYPCNIGRNAGGGYYFNGYIDDFRITKGAIYTKNFAPGPLSELPATDPINLNLL